MFGNCHIPYGNVISSFNMWYHYIVIHILVFSLSVLPYPDAPRRMLMPVKLQDYRGSWLQRNPAGPLTLTWKPELLDRSWLDVEQPENGTATPPGSGDLKVDKVNVLLMGYKELEAPDGQPQVWDDNTYGTLVIAKGP